MKTYEEFTTEIKETMETIYPNEMVELTSTRKNNNIIKVGITIRKSSTVLAPCIYLEEPYDKYLSGICMEDIIKELQNACHFAPIPNFNANTFLELDFVKDKIVYKLINLATNKELLETIPYIPYLDLAIVFYVMLEKEDSHSSTLLVNYKLMKEWNVTTKELEELAKENTPNILPYKFTPMSDVISELLGHEVDSPLEVEMYVLNNTQSSFGAITLLYDNVLENIEEKLQAGFYVLPSSIHEVLVVPMTSAISKNELIAMVESVNSTEVSPQEILSNNVYTYNTKTHCLEL